MDDEGKLYFIELNARIQVEHPITEAVTGIDLVKSQLLLAAGEPLSSIVSGKIEPRGHAIECRINAENPKTFVPSAGRITQMLLPGGPGIRVDTAAYSGWFVPTVLRLACRETHRAWTRPHRGHQPHAALPRHDVDGGNRHIDPLSRASNGRPGFCPWELRYALP